MRNYKMVLAYDGSRYKGWQRLGREELTIQETVEHVIGDVLDYVVEIHGSGRTDAGVHARGQVVHMKIPFLLKEDFREKVNQGLPEDIQIMSVEKVSGNFHARYNATEKIYKYYVDTKERPDVFLRKYVYHFPKELDMEAMKEAAGYLVGKHDFTSFTDDKTKDKDRTRTIHEILMKERTGMIEFVYRGDGFMQHMVRILTGTLLEVGIGAKCPKDMQMIFEKKERAAAGAMVPAKGLFLDKVDYN